MKIQLDKRFTKKTKGVFEKYSFEVGILVDSVHKEAVPSSLKSFAGGPARRTSNRSSGVMVSEVSEHLRKRFGNFYTLPFSSGKNKDILNFTKSFFDLCAGRSQAKRCENMLQAIVRNPILRGDYGRNSKITANIKGFNRLMIDTAQFFKSITAKVKVLSVQK
jgi:hypothetical protein